MRHGIGSFGGCRLKVSRLGVVVGCCFARLVLESYIFSFWCKASIVFPSFIGVPCKLVFLSVGLELVVFCSLCEKNCFNPVTSLLEEKVVFCCYIVFLRLLGCEISDFFTRYTWRHVEFNRM